MNVMDKIAAIFGFELYEEFKVEEFPESVFRFTESGLQYKPADKWLEIPRFINAFLTGRYKIIQNGNNAYKEALESLQRYCADADGLATQFQLLDELVQKTIIQPVVKMDTIDGRTIYRCPNCYGIIEPGNYCSYCGQKLDEGEGPSCCEEDRFLNMD